MTTAAPADERPILRATAEDMTSLAADVGAAPMQVGAILLLDAPGGLDLTAGRDAIAQRVRSVPRLRQRLQAVPPGCGRPIWVDHEGFDIDQHVSIDDGVHAYGGSVNDVVLSAIDGALGRLLRSRGEVAGHLVASVPVSRRQATTTTQLGNQVGVAPIELPGLADRAERLRVIVGRGARIRSAPRGASTDLLGSMFRLLAKLRLLGWFIDRQRLVNTFVTNLRGPDQQLHLLGSAITDVFPLVGISGNVTVSFAVFSYAGALTVTVIADPDAVEDLSVLRDALQDELDRHIELAP